jgi:pyruvate dehydrogenase E1 component beta subunit
VIFMESKALYRSFREEVPDEPEREPLGRARVARQGDDITLVAWGAMLPRTVEAAEVLAREDGVEAEVIDLVSVAPLDSATVVSSVRRTGRAAIVHEAPKTYGPGAEITARLNEQAFYRLRAPVQRIAGYDVPVPYFARENDYLPDVVRIVAGARRALEAEA